MPTGELASESETFFASSKPGRVSPRMDWVESEIRDRHTFVGVPKESAEAVLAAFSGRSAHEKELVVEIARAEQRTNESAASSS